MGLLDIVINFIAKRKVKALERAFRKNQKFVDSIKAMDKAYEDMGDIIDEYCKKYPEDCKKAEELRKKYGV